MKTNETGHEMFSRKIHWAIKYLTLLSPGLQNSFLKNFRNLPPPPSYVPNAAPLLNFLSCLNFRLSFCANVLSTNCSLQINITIFLYKRFLLKVIT